MPERMNWSKLLSTKRVTDYGKCNTKVLTSQYTDPRSAFERDCDQLTFSYPFRRLQDKTQVIPFPKYDFVHTRLTHSLEVASVGRSFGKMAAELIFEELDDEFVKEHHLNKSDIGALVGAACLAHDIGNPPFGHSGEDAISYYFLRKDSNFKPDFEEKTGKLFKREYDYESRSFSLLEYTPNEEEIREIKRWKDLSQFEGNANGFRILTKNCEKGIFKKEYENIMTGQFDKALIECIDSAVIKTGLYHMQCLVRKFIYQYPPVLESEASGFEVMEHLIGSFAITSNICFSCGDEETAKDQKLRSLLPEEFQPVAEKEIEQLTQQEKYERVLTVLDYISGMTDKYAINLYRKTKGISIER